MESELPVSLAEVVAAAGIRLKECLAALEHWHPQSSSEQSLRARILDRGVYLQAGLKDLWSHLSATGLANGKARK